MTLFRQSMLGSGLNPDSAGLNFVTRSVTPRLESQEYVIVDPGGIGDQLWFGQYIVPKNFVGGTTPPKIIAQWGSPDLTGTKDAYFQVQYRSVSAGESVRAAVQETLGPDAFTDSATPLALMEAAFEVTTPGNIASDDQLRWGFARIDDALDTMGQNVFWWDLIFEFADA